jgi:anaerobic magnesium-protoporphyrin IX monomethyl ester cyclase
MPPLSRAAVIVPPLSDFYFTSHRFSSLGAHIAKKLIDRQGITTSFFNFPLIKPRGTPQPLPSTLSYLEPFLIENEIGRTSFFTRFRRYGPDIQTCARMIADERPDICFFSVFAFAYADSALALADLVKKSLPDVPIVMGGGGPSSLPEYFLHGTVYCVLTGEAEATLEPFLYEIQKPLPDLNIVPNLVWRENGSIRRSVINSITPGKDIEVVLQKTAQTFRLTTYSTSLSRGCPMNCSFCSSHFALGKPFRTPALDRVDNALSSIIIDDNTLKKQLVINLEDDNLCADNSFLRTILTSIRTRFPGVEFIMENGIDYRFLTPEKITWLMSNGMKKFNLSLGSIDTDILRSKNRSCSFEQYEAILDLLDRHHLPSITYFICGFREDTVDTIARNLRYLAAKNTAIGISPFYAVPGIIGCTYPSLFKSGVASRCLGAACYPWNSSLSTETMVTTFRLARYINLTKDSNRTEIESQLIDKIEDTQSLHTLVREPGSKAVRVAEVERQDRKLVGRFFRDITQPLQGRMNIHIFPYAPRDINPGL